MIGAFLFGAIGAVAAQVVANLLVSPVFRYLTYYRLIWGFRWADFFLSDSFPGTWEFTWKVKSPQYSGEQSFGGIRIFSFFNYVAFEVPSGSKRGDEAYRFVGRNEKGRVTGRWYHKYAPNGYDGCFQLVWRGGTEKLDGKWLGWSEGRTIKADSMTLKREFE